MSKYTTEVRFICEMYAELNESVGYDQIDKVIERARGKIFDFKYPIFDEVYRSVLETKILKHFYTREIGAETVGLWKLWLSARMNEIMPYYNKLYKSELLDFNPLYDIDITRERKGETEGTKAETGTGVVERIGNSNSSDTNVHYDYYSDTPQGSVGNLEDLTYLTNARKVTDTGSNNTEDSVKTDSTTKVDSTLRNTEDYLETVRGKQGGSSYAKMLLEYRDTFLNIDMQVINELNDLFFNLW